MYRYRSMLYIFIVSCVLWSVCCLKRYSSKTRRIPKMDISKTILHKTDTVVRSLSRGNGRSRCCSGGGETLPTRVSCYSWFPITCPRRKRNRIVLKCQGGFYCLQPQTFGLDDYLATLSQNLTLDQIHALAPKCNYNP